MNKKCKKRLVNQVINDPKYNKGFKTENNRIRGRFRSHVNMTFTERLKFLFKGVKYYD